MIHGPRSVLRIPDANRFLFATLSRLNGFDDLATIYERVERHPASLELIELVDFCRELCSRGALVEASMAWRIQYDLECNPQPYPSLLDERQVGELTTRRKLARAGKESCPPLSPLGELLSRRESCRNFDQAADMTHVLVERLAAYAQHSGIRGSASAGALYPTGLTAFIRRRGEWRCARWLHNEDRLEVDPYRTIGATHLRYALDSEDLVHGASAFFVLSAEPAVQALKYSNRGYRFAVLECGQIAQSIALAATESGLGSIEWGGFREPSIAALAGLGEGQLPILVIAVGVKGDPAQSRSQAQAAADVPGPTVVREPVISTAPAGFVVAQHFAEEGPLISTGVGWTTQTAVQRSKGEYVERRAFDGHRSDWFGTSRALGGTQYDVEQEWPATLGLFRESGYLPFDRDRPYHWVAGSTASNEVVHVPADLVYVNGGLPTKCGRPTSSGLAAHRTESLARHAALLELVERDAFVRAWTSKTAPKLISPSDLACFGFDPSEYPVVSGATIRVVQFAAALPTVGVAILASSWPALSYGLATRDQFGEALQKAFLDAYASYTVSLTSVPEQLDRRPLDPAEHLAYSRTPSRAAEVSWFFSGDAGLPDEVGRPDPRLRDTAYFSLPTEFSGWHVVRAMNSSMRRIWFGDATAPIDAQHLRPHFFS